jgi:aspartokinase
MTSAPRLGGFKILKDVTRIAVVSPTADADFPATLCRAIAQEKVNLPYLTIVFHDHSWGLNVIVEAFNGERVSKTIKKNFGRIFSSDSKSAVLSIFPHKKNPDITGRLFEAFDQEGLEPDALGNSPSAISVIIKEELIAKASDALFEPFSFGPYRTPADWKLAQKGKEALYKEVVASYQEKRPKVYGLEYYEGQDLVQIRLDRKNMSHVGTSFRGFARLGLDLSFVATSPSEEMGKEILAFCLPSTESQSYTRIIGRIAPEIKVETTSPVVILSMNGPHFGDRYGIASEVLSALNNHRVDLLGLSCTIASITGVFPSHQFEPAIRAIQDCFDVPSITKKD